MSDTNGNKDRGSKKLQLTRTVESGKVQQTFSRGRSKTVMVEVKKTRTIRKDSSTESKPFITNPEEQEDTTLTESERKKRKQVLERAAEDAKRKAEQALKKQVEEELPKSDGAEEEIIDKTESATEKEERPKKEVKQSLKIIDPGTESDVIPSPEKEIAQKQHEKKKKHSDEEPPKPVKAKAFDDHKHRKVKLTITNAFDQEERVRSLASIKRQRQKVKRQANEPIEHKKTVREIILPETIAVQELANRMAIRVQEVIRELMKLGEMKQANDEIDADTAELVVTELGHTFKRVTDADIEDILKQPEPNEADLKHRPPVVTIMGHVDHGKTSLLDALRKTNITEGEAGGITQHIGAYQIATENGQKITFLDTPGHEAFTAMRQRGANITDIVVLVVAADDGIMPQTIEAISHAKAAEVPIIVAVNKIDKPEADINRIKNDLLVHELVPEDLGGDIQVVGVSAKTGEHLEDLLDAILLQSEMLELTASANMRAEGTVIEAHLDKGKGVVTTLLVQQGTLRIGDIIVAGRGFGRIKSLSNDRGMALSEALPAQPVEALGLNDLPSAGDEFAVTETEKQARDITDYRFKLQRDLKAVENDTDLDALDKLFQTAKDGSKELRLVIKGDVQGSVEAIQGSLEKLSNEEVTVKFLHCAAGAITESDVTLAATTGAMVIGFNVRAGNQVKQLADEENVDIRYYSVIYNLIDDMKAAVGGLMAPIIREEFIGYAEILQVFKMSKAGKVAGCKITDGVVKRGAGVRLLRDNVVIHEGKLKTLKRFKEDVNEVKEGYECGIAFENYEDLKEGDIIEAYEIIEEAATLE